MRNEGISLKEAAAWCGGTVAPSFSERRFRGAQIDSRKLRGGELFVCIVGARDGHEFARAAIEAGAAAVLASRPLPAELPAIYVPDTEHALQDIAKAWRERLRLRCVGVTGSVGKTSTKEMIAAVLSTTFVTGKTPKNFNNGLGLPMTVLGLAPDCEAAVLEMGMNHFGELSALTSIAQPDLAVITNVGTMHIENLGSREGILRAKLEILEGLRPGGAAVFHGDNDPLAAVAKEHHALTFGLGAENEIRAEEIVLDSEETRFTAVAFGERFPVTIHAAGAHNVPNALAAVAAGLHYGVTPARIAAGLADYQPTGLREKHYDKNGLHIIEDCYNAGPESMQAALDVLAKASGRKIAVLGGMLELGNYAPKAHFAAGRAAARAADLLFAYGAHSEDYVCGAQEAGMRFARSYPSHEALVEALHAEVRAGDTLLVKGSRGMKMERVLQLLFDERKTEETTYA